MNCVIAGPNIKILSKALQALSKIGDELHLEAKTDQLVLRSVNMTTTAYFTFAFRDSFFSSYEIDDDAETDSLKCIILMKAVLGVFKHQAQKDKKPEACQIELKRSSTKITFRLKYNHDVVVVHALHLSDGETIEVNYNRTMPNEISGSSALFAQILTNFQLGDDDMGVEVTASKALMRNYSLGDESKPKGIRSQITLNAAEFNTFRIETDACITYSLKPFRAAVQFAEVTTQMLYICFEKSGRPALLIIRSVIFEAHFLIATLNNGNDITTQTTGLFSLKKRANPNITIQDQQALESVDWENDFGEPAKGGKGPEDAIDVVANSPESPRSKKIKLVFERCFEATFNSVNMDLGEVLAPDSDPDT